VIKPLLQGDQFLADVHQAAAESERLHLWWLGQSGFLVQWQGIHLLLDPYLSDSLTKKYADTTKPHVRMTEIVVPPGRLDFIDVVTSSHNHTDHLDSETLGPLLAKNPELTILVPRANLSFAANRLGVSSKRLSPLQVGQMAKVGPYTLHAVPAAHEQAETDEEGFHKFIGLVIEAGPFTLYHSGDTMRYDGMAEWLRRWRIDVALLPINGCDPARGVAGNLSGPEAVELAHDIGAGMVIPCHYDMFEFNTVTPDAFVEAAQLTGQPCQVLKCGQRYTL
jgi:L-ascorbate metabolism protein UlaG (beta-lactamase superfamily)